MQRDANRSLHSILGEEGLRLTFSSFWIQERGLPHNFHSSKDPRPFIRFSNVILTFERWGKTISRHSAFVGKVRLQHPDAVLRKDTPVRDWRGIILLKL